MPTCSYFKHISNIIGNLVSTITTDTVIQSASHLFIYVYVFICNIFLVVPSNVIRLCPDEFHDFCPQGAYGLAKEKYGEGGRKLESSKLFKTFTILSQKVLCIP